MSMTITECEVPHFQLTEDARQFKDQLEEAIQQCEEPETHPLFDATFRASIHKASEKVVENVQGLVSSINDIRSLFSAISKDLHGFDLAAESDRATERPLKPEWEVHHAKFDELLNKSHKNAREAMVVLNNYNDLFPEGTPIDKSRYEEIQAEVQNLIASIDDDGKDAFEIEQGFTKLARKIREFGITIERAVTVHTPHVRTNLEDTRRRVNDLSIKLSVVKSEMRNAGLACVACLSAGAISAAFLFFTLSPSSAHVFVTSVLAAVPSAIKFQNKIQESRDLKKSIKEGKADIARLSKEYDVLAKYQSLLGNTKHDIEDLCTKIDAIAGIWQALKADFHELDAELKKAVGPKIKYTSFIHKKIANSRVVYNKLTQLLEAYVNGVQVFAQAEK